jgi:hypothetical protein
VPRFALIAALIMCFASPPRADEAVTESTCLVIARGSDGSTSKHEVDSLHVLASTAQAGSFALPQNSPADVQALMCGRSSIIPALADYKVLEAGYPLYIATNSEKPQRIGVLEMSRGQVRFRLVEGKFTSAEETTLQARLNALQSSLDKSGSESNQRLERP